MAADLIKDVDQYKKDLRKEAEALIKDAFPKQIVTLNKLLSSEQFCRERQGKVPADLNIPIPDPALWNNEYKENPRKRPRVDGGAIDAEVTGTKVYALPNGVAPSNKSLVDLMKEVKPYIYDMLDHCNKIKMWITFQIPKIEDGNNFGVSIQEDVLSEARTIEQEAAQYLDQMSRFFASRGKFVSKVAKYPHIEDYRQAVKELDEKQYFTLTLTLVELRNHYATLHDIISKNLEKIKKPRTTNTDNMF